MKSLMLLSQPNTGSTWLASCIRIATPSLASHPDDREWFNPGWNWQYQMQLGQVFGGDLPQTIDNLARMPSEETLEAVLQLTWDKAQRQVTKETYLAYQADSAPMRRRFITVGLLRGADESFPPGRGRMKVWYNNWFEALTKAGILDPATEFLVANAITAEDRALVAWQVVRWKLESVFKRLGSPVFDYTRLTTDTERGVLEYLMRLDLPRYIDTHVFARAIVNTRVPRRSYPQFEPQWDNAFDLLESFRKRYPGLC